MSFRAISNAAGLLLAAVFLLPAAGVREAAGQDAAGQVAVEQRLTAFREMGSATKNIRDELASPMPDLKRIQEAIGQMAAESRGIPTWFPPGSGRPEDNLSGWKKLLAMVGFGPQKPISYNPMRTRAKPEVWSAPADLKAIYDRLPPALQDLSAATEAGDLAAVRAKFDALNKICGECHDRFRYGEDE